MRANSALRKFEARAGCHRAAVHCSEGHATQRVVFANELGWVLVSHAFREGLAKFKFMLQVVPSHEILLAAHGVAVENDAAPRWM